MDYIVPRLYGDARWKEVTGALFCSWKPASITVFAQRHWY